MVLIRAAVVGTVLAMFIPSTPVVADESDLSAASIWDGIYTETQVQLGEFVYPEACGKCHGFKLDGAPDDPDMFSTPPIAGPKFLRDWNGISLAALFEYTRTTMPENNPGSLSDQEFAAVIAYMLSISGMPAAANELQPNITALAGIVIQPNP